MTGIITAHAFYTPQNTIYIQLPPIANKTATSPFQAETGLPPGWEVRHSNSKNLPYYFNSVDRTSRWEPPAGTDSEKLKLYMAAHHSASSRPGAVPGVPEGKIRAAHLLVKHRESRRPSSWREVRNHVPLHLRKADTYKKEVTSKKKGGERA